MWHGTHEETGKALKVKMRRNKRTGDLTTIYEDDIQIAQIKVDTCGGFEKSFKFMVKVAQEYAQDKTLRSAKALLRMQVVKHETYTCCKGPTWDPPT